MRTFSKKTAIALAIAVLAVSGASAALPAHAADVPVVAQEDIDALIRFLPEFEEIRSLPATPENRERFLRFAAENGLDLDRFILAGSRIGVGVAMLADPLLEETLGGGIPEPMRLSAAERQLVADNLPRIREAIAKNAPPPLDAEEEFADDAAVVSAFQGTTVFASPLTVMSENELSRLVRRIPEARRALWVEILPGVLLFSNRDFAAAESRFARVLSGHPAGELGDVVHAYLLRVHADSLVFGGRFDEALIGYRKVLERYSDDANPVVTQQRAVALFGIGLAHFIAGRADAAETGFRAVIDAFAGREEPFLRYQIASAHNNLAVLLSRRGDTEAAFGALDAGIAALGESGSVEFRELAARIAVAGGVLRLQAGDLEKAREIFDDVLARYADGPPAVAAHAVNAVNNNLLIAKTREDAAMAADLQEALIAAFGRRTEPELGDLLFQVGVSRAVALAHEDDADAALELLDVLMDCPAARHPALRERFADALWFKGLLLDNMGEYAKAAAVFESFVAGFADERTDKIRQAVSRAFASLALARKRNGDYDGAADAYRAMAAWCDAEEENAEVGIAVAANMRLLAEDLLAEGRADEAFAVYEDIVARFGDKPYARRSADVAYAAETLRDSGEAGKIAMVTQAAMRRGMERKDDTYLNRLGELLERYAGRREPEVDDAVGGVMLARAVALFHAKRYEEGDALLEEVVVRYGAREDSGGRRITVRALLTRAGRLRDLGETAAAAAAYRDIMERFGDDASLRMDTRVARLELEKIEGGE